MAESLSLRLVHALGAAEAALLSHLVRALAARGHRGISAPMLGFLGQLDCGVNGAAEIARRLGVSRQMVSRTVGEMEAAGFLAQVPDPERRNRKAIVFTDRGTALMAEARAVLAALDATLGEAGLGPVVEALEALPARTEAAG